MKKLQARLDALEGKKKEESKAKEKEDKESENEEIKKQNCENSRKNLAALEARPRIRLKMEDGSYKQLTDEEKKAEIEKAKNGIEKFCE
jgi:hypothetical protein